MSGYIVIHTYICLLVLLRIMAEFLLEISQWRSIIREATFSYSSSIWLTFFKGGGESIFLFPLKEAFCSLTIISVNNHLFVSIQGIFSARKIFTKRQPMDNVGHVKLDIHKE